MCRYAGLFYCRFRKHRALKILRPTTELTGVYKCKVGSLEDEDFMAKKMVVYGKDNFEVTEATETACVRQPRPRTKGGKTPDDDTQIKSASRAY